MFQVLRCFKCEVFQVHQVKKSNRWRCKMCNEMQSHKRRYGIGTGKECRMHVQKLNSLRGNIETLKENMDSLSDKDESEDDEVDNGKETYLRKSKWSHFVSKEESEHEEEPHNTMYLNNIEVVLEVPTKVSKRKFDNIEVDGKINKFKKQNENKYKKYNEDNVDVSEIQSNDVNTIQVEVKAKTKQKFVPPKFVFKTDTSSHQASKWDDFTIGHVANDSGLMYLDSQYQQTRLGDPEYHQNKVNCEPNDCKVSKNTSKWGQFIDDENIIDDRIGTHANDHYQNEEDSFVTTKAISRNGDDLKNMFSLCDDNELDDVLNL